MGPHQTLLLVRADIQNVQDCSPLVLYAISLHQRAESFCRARTPMAHPQTQAPVHVGPRIVRGQIQRGCCALQLQVHAEGFSLAQIQMGPEKTQNHVPVGLVTAQVNTPQDLCATLPRMNAAGFFNAQ